MQYKHPLEVSLHPVNPDSITASVIWLHGLGADGYDFVPVVRQLLDCKALQNVRYILPHAPEMPVTRNAGYIMPAWYDVYGMFPVQQEDEVGIQASQDYINTLIQKEIERGTPSERIVLAGFSQGGAVALHTALRYPHKLGGVLALSTYLPLHAKLPGQAAAANQNIPIFMAHGIFDDVITLEMSKLSCSFMQSCAYVVDWHEYRMAHSVCPEEIADIEAFLTQALP